MTDKYCQAILIKTRGKLFVFDNRSVMGGATGFLYRTLINPKTPFLRAQCGFLCFELPFLLINTEKIFHLLRNNLCHSSICRTGSAYAMILSIRSVRFLHAKSNFSKLFPVFFIDSPLFNFQFKNVRTASEALFGINPSSHVQIGRLAIDEQNLRPLELPFFGSPMYSGAIHRPLIQIGR